MPAVLKNHVWVLIVGTLLALLIAGVSGVTFALIGPLVKVLMGGEGSFFALKDLLGPYLSSLGEFFNIKPQAQREEYLYLFSQLLLGSALLRALFTQSHWLLWEGTSEKIAYAYRERLLEGLVYFDPKKSREEQDAASLSSLMSVDLRVAREYIVHFYGSFPREALQGLIYLSILWFLSPKLFTIFICGLVPSGIALRALGARLRRRSKKALENYAETTEWVAQRLRGSETIKQYQAEDYESKNFAIVNKKLMAKLVKVVRVRVQTPPLLEFVGIAAFSAVIFVALGLVMDQDIGGGVMVSFFSTLAIFAQSVGKLGRYFNSNKEGMVALKRLEDFLANAKKNEVKKLFKTKKRHSSKEDGLLIVKDLEVGFSENHVAFKGFSKAFYPHKIYALLGPSGSGKSTLIKTLLGLVKQRSGEILFHESLDLEKDLAYTPQDIKPSSEEIWRSVVYPDLNQDETRVLEALERVGLSNAAHLKASQLSGGQLQRVFLARLWYRQPRIVFVDEGTSALDPEMESLILSLLRELADGGACLILAAHRANMIEMADEAIDLGEY